VSCEERFDSCAQFLVALAILLQESRATAAFELEGGVKEPFDLAPALRLHRNITP